MMILVKDNKGVSPIEKAMKMNSPKLVEICLNFLLKISEFNTSRALYKKFDKLFNMNLKAFENYLEICYFQTPQMADITKLCLKGKDDHIYEHVPCAVLGGIFFNKYSIKSNAD